MATTRKRKTRRETPRAAAKNSPKTAGGPPGAGCRRLGSPPHHLQHHPPTNPPPHRPQVPVSLAWSPLGVAAGGSFPRPEALSLSSHAKHPYNTPHTHNRQATPAKHPTTFTRPSHVHVEQPQGQAPSPERARGGADGGLGGCLAGTYHLSWLVAFATFLLLSVPNFSPTSTHRLRCPSAPKALQATGRCSSRPTRRTCKTRSSAGWVSREFVRPGVLCVPIAHPSSSSSHCVLPPHRSHDHQHAGRTEEARQHVRQQGRHAQGGH